MMKNNEDKKITEIIDELLAYENCVFRGENQQYGKVSSKLYRQYLEGKNAIKNENFSILTVEKDLIEKAKTHILGGDNIEILTELQHYGGKTALIDFTYNMLIALFFACDGEFGKDGRIIVFNTNKATQKTDIDYKDKDIYRIIAPTGKSPRVIFQSSVFIHTEQGYVDKKDCKFITIEKQQKKALLEHLRKYFNIETATIYNDIHGFIQNQDNYITAGTEFHRGVTCHKNKEFKQAITHYSKAIEINPQLAEAYNNRGLAKFDLGEYQEAITDYDTAIEINTQYAEAYYNRGGAKYSLDDKNAAIADYDIAIETNPQYANAYSNRGIAKFDLGEYQEAITDYNTAIKINPQLADAYSNRGNAKSVLGDKNAAIIDHDKAIEINPQLADAYYNRGGAKSALGNKKDAIKDYDKAIKINPQDAEAYYNRGVAKSALGDKKGAIADVEQVKILYKQQGKMENFAKVEQVLKKLKNDK